MSVYTPVTAEELEAWLTRYAVGALVAQSPIAAGIENTNYFVTTTKGRYVLTLYERLPADELPFYLNLMAHLARAGVECPAPDAATARGALFSMLNGKPAEPRHAGRRRAGRSRRTSRIAPPSARRSARLHVASATYRARLTNRRGPAWWRQAARAVRPFVDAGAERAARGRAQVPDGLRQGPHAARRDPRRSLLRQRAVRRRARVRHHRFRLCRDRFPRLRSRDHRQRLVHRRDGDCRRARPRARRRAGRRLRRACGR